MIRLNANKYILKAYVDKKELDMKKKSIAFFRSKKIDVEEKLLGDFGDIAVLLSTKEYLNIERKTFNDFVTSYISGHLQDQAIRMNKVSDNYCVIVYGSINDLWQIANKYPAVKRIKQQSIDKMVRALTMVYKCPVFFVKNEATYFLEIMNIAETLCKNSGSSLKQKTSRARVHNRPDIEFLMLANRIGEKTAMLLIKEFGTPEKVINASRQDLLKINGIGDSTITDIKQLRKVFYEGV